MSETTVMASATPAATLAPVNISSFDTGLAGVNQVQNMIFRDSTWWSFGIVALLILTFRLIEITWSHLRHITAMSQPSEAQAYWRTAQWRHMPWIKKHLTYAPIWGNRHNREIRLSAALNIGTLPTRLQALLLLGYLGSNIAYMADLSYSKQSRWATLAELRGRSGTLAAVNMVPLVIFAGRNNPLIGLLRISFDTFNLVHRWVGRTAAVEAIIHTIAWLVVQLKDGGWQSVSFKIVHDRFIASGTVGTLAFLMLVIISFSPLRHAFYETFLATHILLAFIIILATWIHCVAAAIPGGLPQLPYVIAIVVLWLLERLGRVGLSAWRSWSRHGWPEAVVEPLPGECCRVTVHLPRYANVRPGTHAYLRFLSINPWECHPFSIAWVDHKPILGSSGNASPILPLAKSREQEAQVKARDAGVDWENKRTDMLRTSVSFVIGAQTGFTRKLYNYAQSTGQNSVSLNALVEGPYAGHHSLDSYGHAVLIAGATGITHQISYLRHLIEGYAAGTVATRRITLVWIVRDYESLEWVRPWMNEVMRLPHRPEILQVRIFVTRPKNTLQLAQSRSIQMFPGRPNIAVLLQKEVAEQKGAMCVTVCGPGALADDVRSAVRDVVSHGTVVDFIEESFTW